MKLLENRSDVVNGGGSGYYAGSCILDQLKFMKGFVREAEKERVAVVQTGSDETVDKDSCSVGGKGRGKGDSCFIDGSRQTR